MFVSHDMGSVQRFCDRAIVIHDSKLIYEGDSEGAVYEYKKLNFPDQFADKSESKTRWGTGKVQVVKTKIDQKISKARNDLIVDLEIEVKDKTLLGEPLVIGLGIFNAEGLNIAGPNTRKLKQPIKARNGHVRFTINDHNINSGVYYITSVIESPGGETIDHRERDVQFTIARSTNEFGAIISGGEWEQDVSEK